MEIGQPVGHLVHAVLAGSAAAADVRKITAHIGDTGLTGVRVPAVRSRCLR
jgi:hypothetical protein